VCCTYWALAVTKNKYLVSAYFTVHLNFLCGFIIISSFCSCVERRAFLKLFHLDLSKANRLASFQLSPAFCSSHSPVRFQVFYIYPSSLYLEGSSPMRVFQLHLVVLVVYCQSSAIFFPLFVVE